MPSFGRSNAHSGADVPMTNRSKTKSKSKDGFTNKLEEKIVRMKVQAVLFIMVFVVPGNLVTLIIYATSESTVNNGTLAYDNTTILNATGEASEASEILWYDEAYADTSETTFFSEDHGLLTNQDDKWDDQEYDYDGNDTLKNDCGNESTCLTHTGYFCHEKFSVIENLDSVRFWIEGVSLTTVSTVGLFGNLLTVVVIHKIDNRVNGATFSQQQGRSPLDTILVALITLDSFFLFFSLFDSAYLASFHMPEPYWYKVLFPYLWHPLKSIVTSGCVFMVVAVAAERYFAICNPLGIKPKPIFFISLVMLASFLINVPKFFEFKHLYNNGTLQYWTSDLNENANYVVFSSYYECAVFGVAPLLALCYLNYMIYTGIRRSTKMEHLRHIGGSKGSKANAKTKTRRQADEDIECEILFAPPESQGENGPGTVTEHYPMVKILDRRGSKLSEREHLTGNVSPTHINKSYSKRHSQGANKTNGVGFCRRSSLAVSQKNDYQLGSLMSVRSPTAISPNNQDTLVPNINGELRGSDQRIECGSRVSSTNKERRHFQKKSEKSTGILVGIIIVFVVCHVLKLTIQIYEIVSPTHGLQDHYHECYKLNRLHVPAMVLIAGSVNHLLLVVNSSVNFLIYCCLAKRFRSALINLFRSRKCFKSRKKPPILFQFSPNEETTRTDLK